MTDGGPWRGPSTSEWVERIARGSTPVREYVDGKFVQWIDVTLSAPPSAHGVQPPVDAVVSSDGGAEDGDTSPG